MRVLQICTSFNAGGIQRHVMQLSDSLRAGGHEVFLAGAAGTWLDDTAGPQYLPLDLRSVSTETGATLRRVIQAVRCAWRLRSFLARNRIELIHAHESAPAIVAKLASVWMGIPIVITYHGSAPDRVRPFGRIGRLTAQRVITPSHRCAAALHAQAGVPLGRIDVIGLGVAPPPAIPQDVVAEHRHRLLGESGTVLVVIVARLAHQKGIDVLVEVARRVSEQRPGFRFVVIGDGPQRDQARSWAEHAGVTPVLRFEGESTQPYLYLKAADIFLLTSRWEALPISIAEAFQVGVPVVATDVGGVRELVTPAVGRVVPVGDAAALCEAVIELADNPELRRNMSEAALRLAREDRFSLSHVHRIFERVYAGLLTTTTRRGGPQ